MTTLVNHHRFLFFSSPLPSTVTLQTSTARPPVVPSASSSPLLSISSLPKHEEEAKKITSVSNPIVKHCVKLRLSSSYRRQTGSVLIIGLTPIMEMSKFHRKKNPSFSLVDQLILLEGFDASEELKSISDCIIYVGANVMKKISGMQSIDSTQVIGVIKKPNSFCDFESIDGDEYFHKLLPSPHRLLVLDGIQDPGNLGTLIRSARAFKWDGVFLLNGCCDPFNEKALRAARGASFQLPIISGDWSRLNSFVSKRKIRIFAGHPANNVDDSKASSSLSRHVADELASEALCLVLGSEGNGLSREAIEKCELISIPMEGMFESLNVSVAGGIFLFMLRLDKHRD